MLTDADVRNIKPRDKTFKLSDSHGLHLEVRTNGVKSWRYRYKLGGKENMFAIGDYPTVTLKDARKARDAARILVVKGIHPARHRRLEKLARMAESEDTVENFARVWFEHNSDWAPSYRKQVQSRMEGDVLPWLGKLALKDVKPAHILDVLKRVEKRSPVQAKFVQTFIGGLFKHAVVNLRCDVNPAAGLRGAIKKVETIHHEGLKPKEIGAFLRAVDDAPGDDATKAAVRLMWLAACRSDEVVGARWDEFDLDAGLWAIPAGRMKARKAHVIPLSRQALEILQSMQPLSGTVAHVFPQRNDRSKAMNRTALGKLFNRAGYAGKFSPHGVRGTFSTACNEAQWRSDAIELCLAHGEPSKTRASYNAALLIDERRELLQWWADLSDSLKAGGAVLPFRRGAA